MYSIRFTLTIFSLLYVALSEVQSLQLPNRRSTPNLLPDGVEQTADCHECKSSLTFAGEEAKQYAVGTQIPTLPFKTKNSWAGNIAIPKTPSVEDGSLFFWLWGQDAKVSGEDLVLWLNGGPGCSSMIGMTQENGPFNIENDEGPTIPNPFSWTQAANMLYVVQPVGAPFTTGRNRNLNEYQTSDQFALWLNEFLKVFPELKAKKLWIVAESYGGVYLPFIIDALKRNPPAGNTSMFQGGMLIDPKITNDHVQMDVPVYNFAKEHQKLLNFTDDDLAQIKNESDRCHLTDFAERNLHYPPKGRLPTPDPNCSPFDTYIDIVRKNKYFNIYNIAKPHKQTRDTPEPYEDFLNNEDVEKYIHAPTEGFTSCLDSTFGKWGDRSQPPDQVPSYDSSFLGRAIEQSKRFVITNGLLDGIIINVGNRVALQNLSWNGGQGFNKPVHVPLYDMDARQAAMGTDEERKLTYIEVPDCGHMVPSDQPSLGYAALLHLFGRRDWTKKN